jgi:hypothetical protein
MGPIMTAFAAAGGGPTRHETPCDFVKRGRSMRPIAAPAVVAVVMTNVRGPTRPVGTDAPLVPSRNRRADLWQIIQSRAIALPD